MPPPAPARIAFSLGDLVGPWREQHVLSAPCNQVLLQSHNLHRQPLEQTQLWMALAVISLQIWGGRNEMGDRGQLGPP